MAGAARGERGGKAQTALLLAGAVLLSCGLIGAFVHPEAPPELGSLARSDGVSSSIGPGPQFCGRPGPAIGHRGSWVIELFIEGREHCVVVYPGSERQRRLLESLEGRPSLSALHTPGMVWQVESTEGVLVDYATRAAEAESALSQHRTRRVYFLGGGGLCTLLWAALRQRARGARAKAPSAELT